MNKLFKFVSCWIMLFVLLITAFAQRSHSGSFSHSGGFGRSSTFSSHSYSRPSYSSPSYSRPSSSFSRSGSYGGTVYRSSSPRYTVHLHTHVPVGLSYRHIYIGGRSAYYYPGYGYSWMPGGMIDGYYDDPNYGTYSNGYPQTVVYGGGMGNTGLYILGIIILLIILAFVGNMMFGD